MALVVDTGVLVASIEVRDRDHRQCAQLLRDAREQRVVPAPVLVELEYLLRGSSGAFSAFLDDCASGGYSIESLLPEDYARIGELLELYADLRLGFVDASVLAVAERFREPKLATLDHRHFAVVRPRHVGALELVPHVGA